MPPRCLPSVAVTSEVGSMQQRGLVSMSQAMHPSQGTRGRIPQGDEYAREETPFRRKMLSPALYALCLVVFVSLAGLWWYHTSEDATDWDTPTGARGVEVQPQASPPREKERTGGPSALWVAVDETTVVHRPAYAPEWSTEGRVLVRISDWAAAAPSWRVGDRLTLPLPQLRATYQPLIEEIDEGSGAKSVLGRIVGDDGRLRRLRDRSPQATCRKPQQETLATPPTDGE